MQGVAILLAKPYLLLATINHILRIPALLAVSTHLVGVQIEILHIDIRLLHWNACWRLDNHFDHVCYGEVLRLVEEVVALIDFA